MLSSLVKRNGHPLQKPVYQIMIEERLGFPCAAHEIVAAPPFLLRMCEMHFGFAV
jgi:hypothetical protein